MENVAPALSRAEQLALWQEERAKLKGAKTSAQTWRAATGSNVLVPRQAVLADVTNKADARRTKRAGDEKERRGAKRASEERAPRVVKKLKPKTVPARAAPAPKTPRRMVRKPEPVKVKPRLQPKFELSSVKPEVAARLKSLSKTKPEARTEVWKSKVEELMAAVENLHGAATFWLLRSQYAEAVLSSKKPEYVKTLVTPVVLGLDGQAQPRALLMERAQFLIQLIFSKYKGVKGAQQMAGSLQNALRKAYRAVERKETRQGVVARTPARTPRKTPAKAEAEKFLILDGSPDELGDGSIEDLYDMHDWTAPEEVQPEVVEEHRKELEASVEARNPTRLAEAIYAAEEKSILFAQVDAAKKVLIDAMRQTRVADESMLYDAETRVADESMLYDAETRVADESMLYEEAESELM